MKFNKPKTIKLLLILEKKNHFLTKNEFTFWFGFYLDFKMFG